MLAHTMRRRILLTGGSGVLSIKAPTGFAALAVTARAGGAAAGGDPGAAGPEPAGDWAVGVLGTSADDCGSFRVSTTLDLRQLSSEDTLQPESQSELYNSPPCRDHPLRTNTIFVYT
jgi:hypothetical protein